MYVLTHVYTHTLTHIDKDTRTRSPTRTHRQAALNVGHWALLSLKRAETVPNPPLQSGCFRTLREKFSIWRHDDGTILQLKNPQDGWALSYALKNTLTFSNYRQQPPCFAYLNEMVGARRVGEKNRRPTSQYSVQSCAIETVERTIFPSTVAAEKNGVNR